MAKKVSTQPPTASEYELIYAAFEALTPWGSRHVPRATSILVLFDARHTASRLGARLEANQVYALIVLCVLVSSA